MVDPIGTCQALDLLTQEQLEQLFDESNGYLAKVDEIFDTVQIQDMQRMENENSSSSSSQQNSDQDDDDGLGDLPNKQQKPKKREKKPHKRRRSSVITDKKCLILDVDNTLIYVRHFMDEMSVGDIVKLGDDNAIVKTISYRLDLEFSENPGQMSQWDHTLEKIDDAIPQRGEWFPDEKSKVAIIHNADPTGCTVKRIHRKLSHNLDDDNDDQKDDNDNDNVDDDNGNDDVRSDDGDDDEKPKTNDDDGDDDANKEQKDEEDKDLINISFLQNSDELSMLEPTMNRAKYLPVTFMYGGYLVRIRDGLSEFLCRCNTEYDVILFTAADGSVYQGLLKQVHNLLMQQMTENKEQVTWKIPHKLWSKVYFRSDCDEKYDEYGLPYRHKNLAKLGRELSTIVMVDDNPLSYRGFEPNSVRIAGFWGLADPPDTELMSTLFPTLNIVSVHKDVRYHLSGLGQPPDEIQQENPMEVLFKEHAADNELTGLDLLNRQRRQSRTRSSIFLNFLKESILDADDHGSLTDENNVKLDKHNKSIDHDDVDDNDSTSPEKSPENVESDLDSIDSNDVDHIAEKERHNSIRLKQQTEDTINNSNSSVDSEKKEESASTTLTSPFRDDFDKVMAKYSEPNNKQTKKDHNRKESQASQSGIGAQGVVIYDNYDEEDMLDQLNEASENSSSKRPEHQTRGSVEMDPDDVNDDNNMLSPSSKSDGDELEFLDALSRKSNPMITDENNSAENEDLPDFVMGTDGNNNMDPIVLESMQSNSAKSVDQLLGRDDDDDKDPTIPDADGHTRGFHHSHVSTPIDQLGQQIVIEKTSHSCLCFAWFTKNKRNNKSALANQEVR